MTAEVTAVSLSARHSFSKQPQDAVRLLAGRGVEGDAHCGESVQHLYLKRRAPAAPNRMQVHLLAREVLLELRELGYDIRPGELGENITTQGIDLGSLPVGTRLVLGPVAVVELTGLRTPCQQIERFRTGLLKQMMQNEPGQRKVPRAGVMAIVVEGGEVSSVHGIQVILPPLPHVPLSMI